MNEILGALPQIRFSEEAEAMVLARRGPSYRAWRRGVVIAAIVAPAAVALDPAIGATLACAASIALAVTTLGSAFRDALAPSVDLLPSQVRIERPDPARKGYRDDARPEAPRLLVEGRGAPGEKVLGIVTSSRLAGRMTFYPVGIVTTERYVKLVECATRSGAEEAALALSHALGVPGKTVFEPVDPTAMGELGAAGVAWIVELLLITAGPTLLVLAHLPPLHLVRLGLAWGIAFVAIDRAVGALLARRFRTLGPRILRDVRAAFGVT